VVKKAATVKKTGLQGKVKSDFPKDTLQAALRVAQALEDNNGGQPLPPIEAASAIGVSPGASGFRVILSSSIKYGLTSGSYNSDTVALEDRGRDVVEAKSDDARRNALVQGALSPSTFNRIYQHFKGKKLPEASFFENTVVRDFEVPREHAKRCIDIFVQNAEFVGLIKTLPSGKWLSTTAAPLEEALDVEAEAESEAQNEGGASTSDSAKLGSKPPTVPALSGKPKVFIAHGKSPQIVTQLKDVLTFGNFEPVVAEEYETAAKPLPDKVLDLMRGCSAGIIHVASEDELLDKSGGVHHKLNENVLVEIGASMALYGRKFILLVQKGLHLPSNLSGLYCCYYEGDKLDYDATMKLLKAFGEFRTQ
jgi:predicted nucleotide-binding protein